MNALWLSANRFGLELLREAIDIAKNHRTAARAPGNRLSITGIVTLSSQSKTRMYDGVPRKAWDDFDVPVYDVADINTFGPELLRLRPDIIMACGWRQVIRGHILTIPPLGVVGFHPTLLPFGRGPAPIINSILHGVRDSGVTMFYMDEGIDSGDIIGQEEFFIDEDDHADDVYAKVIAAGKVLVRRHLHELAEGTAPRRRQRERDVFYFPKVTVEKNMIDLEAESFEEIYRKVRAFSHPYLGAYIPVKGGSLTIWRAEKRSD